MDRECIVKYILPNERPPLWVQARGGVESVRPASVGAFRRMQPSDGMVRFFSSKVGGRPACNATVSKTVAARLRKGDGSSRTAGLVAQGFAPFSLRLAKSKRSKVPQGT